MMAPVSPQVAPVPTFVHPGACGFAATKCRLPIVSAMRESSPGPASLLFYCDKWVTGCRVPVPVEFVPSFVWSETSGVVYG